MVVICLMRLYSSLKANVTNRPKSQTNCITCVLRVNDCNIIYVGSSVYL